MSCFSGCTPFDQNLLLHLDAANPRSNLVGGNWLDISGNGNDFYSIGTTTFDPTSHGGVLFDSGNEELVLPHNPSLEYLALNDFSVEIVARSDFLTHPLSRLPFYIGGTVADQQKLGWSVGHTNSANYIQVRSGNGTNLSYLNIANPLTSDSKFYHRIFTVSRAAGCLTKYYFNGSLMGQLDAPLVTGAIYNGTTTDHINGIVFGFVWGWRYNGSVNIIKIHKRVLTPAEVQHNFESYRGRYGI